VLSTKALRLVGLSVLVCVALTDWSRLGAQSAPKKTIASDSDLPHFTYSASTSAAVLLAADDATFKNFASHVRNDLETIFRDYEIRDNSVLLHLLSDRLDLEMLFGDDAAALDTCKRMQALFEKREQKAMGMYNDVAFVRARMATGKSGGPEFQKEYRTLLEARTNSLPWDVVVERVHKTQARFQKLSVDYVNERVASEIEPSVSRDKTFDLQTATRLIFWRGVLSTELPQRGIVLEVLSNYIDAHEKDNSPQAQLGASESAKHQGASFDGDQWWASVKILAGDAFEGRGTGTKGLQEAEAYAVTRLKNAGLSPAGTHGFYQKIRIQQRKVDESRSALAILSGNKRFPLSFQDDAFISSLGTTTSTSLKAPLVFIGYGLKIPEYKVDDLASQDLRGKIVVYVRGSPADVPGSISAHYQSFRQRWKALHAAGIIGVISIQTPTALDIPWSRFSLSRNDPAMELNGPEFSFRQGLRLFVTFNPASAERLFAGSGHTYSELAALATERKTLPSFPLAVQVEAKAVIRHSQLESANVIALLPGTDAALKNEFVVLSAHIDHLGIGEPIKGDKIYNGAMDNAAGAAAIMEIAASFKMHPETLRRSVVFLLTTGEEKGHLGSEYFAAHPTVPARQIVADINVDMFLPIVPLKVLKICGLEESDLGQTAATVAKELGIKPIPDPQPLRNEFIRSDQYSFILKGVPAVKIDVGFELGSPEQVVFKDWLTNRYHAPSDDINQPVNLDAAALYERFTRQFVIVAANDVARPQWKPTSFFRRYASDAR
jgi:Peptidase family M28